MTPLRPDPGRPFEWSLSAWEGRSTVFAEPFPYDLMNDPRPIRLGLLQATPEYLQLDSNLKKFERFAGEAKRARVDLFITCEGYLDGICAQKDKDDTAVTRNYRRFVRGEGFKVFPSKFGSIGLLICKDRNYPESSKVLKLIGAILIVVCSYGRCASGPAKMKSISRLSTRKRAWFVMRSGNWWPN